MDNKKRYIQFCKTNSLPLQMQPWWLDIVCGVNNWEACLSYDKQGLVIGILPYYFKSKFGVKRITMPAFTDYIGPYMQFPDEEGLKRVSRYTIETSILSDLVGQLPKTALFYQTYFPCLKNSLPFKWEAYRETTYYTYLLERPIIPDLVFDGFKYTVRTEIRKAGQQVKIDTEGTLEAFYEINSASFKRKSVKNPYDFSVLKKLDDALSEKRSRRLYLARDLKNGAIHAGLYLVWDAKTSYILLTGIDPVLKKSGALYLLYWQAIQDAVQMGLSIDFCGSIIPEIEFSLRSFGGVRQPYFCVSKTGNIFWTLWSILFKKAYY